MWLLLRVTFLEATIIAAYGGDFRPARINYFAKVSVSDNGVAHSHIVVSLSWFKQHIKKDICGSLFLCGSMIYLISTVFHLYRV